MGGLEDPPFTKKKEMIIDKFKSIFLGLEIAYGQYQPGERGDNGKQKGKAFIVRGQVTDELWSNHLAGKGPALGIIPITEDNSCRWGCIDIDEYNFDHTSFIKSIRDHKLPLIVCRSKSGGAHVFLFTKENIPASLMQSKLKEMAIILGYEGSEIFPKQTEILVERGDTGNFLNLPYYNEMKGLRYAINDNGAGCTLEEFYQLYDVWACTKDQVEAIKTEEKKIEEAFPMGPPCLNKLAATGFGQGSRNNALFNIAVYYKQATPDTWEDELVKSNQKYMNPPLNNTEVQMLIKSVNRKGYDKYRCKDAPINSVCQSGLCRTKRFGVGYGEDIDHVKYTILKLMRECPYVLSKPEPRVLLIELGEYAKTFRMFGWVEDYSDEYVARDWLLTNVDEVFDVEGIEIPYPKAVELKEDGVEKVSRRKSTAVRLAKLQMVKEDKQLEAQRSAAKEDIERINLRLKEPDISAKEKAALEKDLMELNSVLSMFEAGES